LATLGDRYPIAFGIARLPVSESLHIWRGGEKRIRFNSPKNRFAKAAVAGVQEIDHPTRYRLDLAVAGL